MSGVFPAPDAADTRDAPAAPVPPAEVAARLATLLGHDLRNALGTILTGAHALQLRLAPDDAETQRLVAALLRASERAVAQATLARDYAQAALAGTVPVCRHEAALGTIAAGAVRAVAAGGGPVTLVAPAPCAGCWDAARLEPALATLVATVAAAAGGGRVTVHVREDADTGVVEIVGEDGDPAPTEGAGDAAAHDRAGPAQFVAARIIAAHGGTVQPLAPGRHGVVVVLPRA